MKKVLSIFARIVAAILLILILAVGITGVSPIYDFRPPKAFSGPDIFNPYRDLDSTKSWKRSLFHTHTRVKGPFPPNECPTWPKETYDSLKAYGYEIVTFSNHNEITVHPFDSTLQVNVTCVILKYLVVDDDKGFGTAAKG